VFRNGGAELRHALGQPRWHTSAVKRQISSARTFHESIIFPGALDLIISTIFAMRI
jgi:hypothetical protein